MKDIVISARGVGKRYRLGLLGGGTLRADLARWWARVRHRPDPCGKIGLSLPGVSEGGYIWALRDVGFEIEKGEVTGIIGRNGAGKSTLLKILSRITAPTAGEIRIRGRVASLLEVGTGFHPELTGRENIYLNGSILGMRRAEVKSKFDEIVAFAEVGPFIDTPVKRYSSGMYVRLAFAVAAHLEPEILLIDEVLAVGDASFQKKCLGKMRDITGQGRTVLFVSHIMPVVESLCRTVIWIDQGRIRQTGLARKVVADYIDWINRTTEIRKVGEYANLGHRRGSGEVQFGEFRLRNGRGETARDFSRGETIRMEVDFTAHKDVERVVLCFGVVDALTQVFVTNWFGYRQPQSLKKGERGTLAVTIPDNPLRARQYYFYLGIIGDHDVPYDIWDSTGTEFTVSYAGAVEDLEFSVGRDVALVSLPFSVEVKRC